MRHTMSPKEGFHFPVLLRCMPLVLALVLCAGCARHSPEPEAVLRIYDWKTGEIYAEVPARTGSELFFGWIHSWENIPWNEYYHVAESRDLILDAITFPAFGAGIPEDKGRVCYVKDGLIHMEQIDQVFTELVWLNSHTATREITLDGALVVRGNDLPQHTRVRLVIEKRGYCLKSVNLRNSVKTLKLRSFHDQ